MTHTQQFIEDAIKGGWKPKGYPDMWNTPRFTKVTEINIILFNGGRNNRWSLVTLFLDPLAWQAVGKTRGWKGESYNKLGETIWEENNHDAFRPYMHIFIDHLADGLSIEEALSKIV